MKVLLIDNGTTLLTKLENLIPGVETVVRFNALAEGNSSNFDLTILSGSSLYPLVGNEEKFQLEMDVIKNTTKPLIGICFGCELIAKAFGGELSELKNRHQGIKEIEVAGGELCACSTLKVYENHRWVISKIPSNFVVLAKSTDGPEVIKHQTLPIYGLQFHPENFVDQTEGDEVFMNLINKITAR